MALAGSGVLLMALGGSGWLWVIPPFSNTVKQHEDKFIEGKIDECFYGILDKQVNCKIKKLQEADKSFLINFCLFKTTQIIISFFYNQNHKTRNTK